eukprot:CAMPEP_0172507796 /NCGR_PEP_ID=MMETSP1066-20121228/206629_1 /TAXON_ID=671091 /ORGANISM="Coscinodiscus wailesii, Strain CCMP2513" /LENGTH=57 /DNA_ID=CAMNT_0013285485 /DNA_START=1 /DNA_END=170 /DNA_ORIENTATION=-
MLTSPGGTLTYLRLTPRSNDGGTFEWTDDFDAARSNAESYYPTSEGIDVRDGVLYMT